VQAFEVQEAYGLIWVRLEPSDSQLPVFAAETDEHLRKVNCGPYDVAASAPRIIENFLDMSHFGFVHEGWLGSRDATAIAAYKVETTATGVLATGCKAVQPQSNLHSTQAAEVEYTYEVTAAYTAVLTKIPEEGSSKQGWREQIGLFICPVTPETSRVWFRLAVADFESTDEQLQTFQHTIFVQDQPVLESQLPKALPLDPRGNALGGRPHVVGLSPLPEGPGDRLRNLLRPALRLCRLPPGVHEARRGCSTGLRARPKSQTCRGWPYGLSCAGLIG
jgi:phenylpropionate dioxygenase-like ring-hydroxylating dioxygenase large terminal subunit